MSPRGLFVGLATLDLIHRVDHHPGADEKILARRCDLAVGGPAAVAAVTFTALGGRGVLLSALGRGPLARVAVGDLEHAGVRVVDSWAGGPDLSVSAITVLESTGERSVVSRNAANVDVTLPAELATLARETDVVLIDGHHPNLAVAAARAARASGVPIVLDCGSAKRVYDELIPLADTVVSSPSFVAGGTARFDEVASTQLSAGAGVAAMTAGAGSVRWRTSVAAGTVDVPSVDVQDTLGAGDVLHGAVAFARAQGVTDPERGLSFGVAVTSLRVQHVGPRTWLRDQRLRSLRIR